MNAHQTRGDNVSRTISEIQSITGVIACALVSKTGTMLGSSLDGEGKPAELIGLMCASVLSSLEAVASIVQVDPPSSVTADSKDAMILLMGAGERNLLIAVVQKPAEESVCNQLHEIAEKIGREM
jgi:uncharacterized protein